MAKAVTRRSHLRRKKGDAFFPFVKHSFSHLSDAFQISVYEVFLPQAVCKCECTRLVFWTRTNREVFFSIETELCLADRLGDGGFYI